MCVWGIFCFGLPSIKLTQHNVSFNITTTTSNYTTLLWSLSWVVAEKEDGRSKEKSMNTPEGVLGDSEEEDIVERRNKN